MKFGEIDNKEWVFGQTAKENWQILSRASQKHWFFHLSKFPSSYVIYSGEELSNNILQKLGKICLNSTKYKNLKGVKVDYCRCSNLLKGEIVGEVIFKSLRRVKQIRID